MPTLNLQIKKLRPGAILPQAATQLSAGLDLHACIDEPLTLPVGEIVTVPCGIAVCPNLSMGNVVMLVIIRSSLGRKHGLTLANSVGVIDSDYRGEILVPIINHGSEPYTFEPGERFAQLVPLFVPTCTVTESEELPESGRTGGFGSTGRI
ncbi:MAG: dUTP diphosphatase [Oscillospiraceae bacterium]|nr:dUTP diphosphatase [Oscillospiraceae bacterium]